MAEAFTVKYKAREGHDLKLEHDGDAGYDLRAARDIVIPFNTTAIIETTVELRLPDGLYATVDSRSGLAGTSDVFVLNAPGIIDTGYEGVIKVILRNLGTHDFTVKEGDRVAQLVFHERVKVDLERVESFAAPAEDASPDEAKAETDEAAPAKRTRGRNGIGSTGR